MARKTVVKERRLQMVYVTTQFAISGRVSRFNSGLGIVRKEKGAGGGGGDTHTHGVEMELGRGLGFKSRR